MTRTRLLIVVVGILLLVVIGLVIERIWVGLGWSMIFTGDMTYASDVAAQYVALRRDHGHWPKPDEIHSRLVFHGSETNGKERIDKYRCGLYGHYLWEVHLHQDGGIDFHCGKKNP
jgi:hypothetical protein